GALAELAEQDRLLLRTERGRLAALALLLAGRVEFVLDHPQWEELVPLQPQDRLQPFEVCLAEEPVAALCAPRRQQALVLEVADLRDRDVRELLDQPTDDLADAKQALASLVLVLELHLLRGARHAMNVIRYLPTCT